MTTATSSQQTHYIINVPLPAQLHPLLGRSRKVKLNPLDLEKFAKGIGMYESKYLDSDFMQSIQRDLCTELVQHNVIQIDTSRYFAHIILPWKSYSCENSEIAIDKELSYISTLNDPWRLALSLKSQGHDEGIKSIKAGGDLRRKTALKFKLAALTKFIEVTLPASTERRTIIAYIPFLSQMEAINQEDIIAAGTNPELKKMFKDFHNSTLMNYRDYTGTDISLSYISLLDRFPIYSILEPKNTERITDAMKDPDKFMEYKYFDNILSLMLKEIGKPHETKRRAFTTTLTLTPSSCEIKIPNPSGHLPHAAMMLSLSLLYQVEDIKKEYVSCRLVSNKMKKNDIIKNLIINDVHHVYTQATYTYVVMIIYIHFMRNTKKKVKRSKILHDMKNLIASLDL